LNDDHVENFLINLKIADTKCVKQQKAGAEEIFWTIFAIAEQFIIDALLPFRICQRDSNLANFGSVTAVLRIKLAS